MKSRPDCDLGNAAEYHQQLAAVLGELGVVLRATGLADCADNWDCPPEHGSYARNLLQFTHDPSPILVGGLLKQRATDPAFFDSMRRDIAHFFNGLQGEWIRKALEPKPTSGGRSTSAELLGRATVVHYAAAFMVAALFAAGIPVFYWLALSRINHRNA
jgi:hypothetical protein